MSAGDKKPTHALSPAICPLALGEEAKVASAHYAVYGEADAAVAIDDLRILQGALPPRVLGLVIEWAGLHQKELAELWRRAQNLGPLGRIDPLQ